MNAWMRDSIILVLIAALIYWGYKVSLNAIRKNVLEKSNRLQKIAEINKNYFFKKNIGEVKRFSRSLSSKHAYDIYDLTNFMQTIINDDPDCYKKLIADIAFNRELYAAYQKVVNQLKFDKDEAARIAMEMWVPPIVIERIENSLFEERKRKTILEINIICEKNYTSPQGRNSYSRSAVFHYNDIVRLLKNANNVQTTKEAAKLERALMSDSMRYDVMKRDGFRCKLCGRSAKEDGVKLQVDHIRPISKGGKTVPGNLRTLCEQCNQGKRAKYDPDGLN